MSQQHGHELVPETQAVPASPQYSGAKEVPEKQHIRCDVCDKVFTRTEHLQRHKRSHSSERPYACVECKKRFARLDILRRHQASHEFSGNGNGSDGTRRYSRACFACASARVKCSGGNVTCQRCRIRDLICQYPVRRKHASQISTREESQGDEKMAEGDDDQSNMTAWSGDNGSNSEVFGSLGSAKEESRWQNPVAMASNSTTSGGQSWNTNDTETTVAVAGAIQQLSSGDSPMSTRDQMLSPNFMIPTETIIAGAELIPEVTEGNIGSLYNYSRINWLPPNDLTQNNQAFGTSALRSTASSKINPQGTFANGSPLENAQANQSVTTPAYFENPYQNPYANSNYIIPAVDNRAGPEAPMYYVDGDGVRLSFPARQKQSLESTHTLSSYEYAHTQIWTTESYIALTEYLKCTPRRDISLSHADRLPSMDELNGFARLYFDKFHDSFPLLHKGSFLDNRDGCLLELVMSAIGACYVGTPQARKSSESLHQLVHALLEIGTESDYNPSEFPGVFGLRRPGYPQRPTRLQARILNVLGMFHSGNQKLASLAREDRAVLVTTCIESKMLMQNHYEGWQAACQTEEEGDRYMQEWMEGELRCRAGYFVWMLDCMMAYESDFRTQMDYLDGKAPLPCPEQIWDQPILNKAQLMILNTGPPSLCFALDVLYTEKKLAPNLGELSRILLIHGMYRRVWEVARHHSDSLSDWVPTALSEPHHRITSETSTKPASNPLVSRWTNGSCDCLDILHWSAHSTILQASGLEHPTILHLHLSRLILLAPVSDLQELAKTKLRRKTGSHSEFYLYSTTVQEQSLQNSVLQWAASDQYKARLAIIHAGSVFWFLRRYSCGAVIEPFANYLATLVLWAYSVSSSANKMLGNSPSGTDNYQGQSVDDMNISQSSPASHPSQLGTSKSPQPNSEDRRMSNHFNPPSLHSRIANALEEVDDHDTSLIQLDRPIDDELVQLFVRFGENMIPYMAKIGDLKSRNSPGKIVREGSKLLSRGEDQSLNSRGHRRERQIGFTWGVAENFAALLSALGAS